MAELSAIKNVLGSIRETNNNNMCKLYKKLYLQLVSIHPDTEIDENLCKQFANLLFRDSERKDENIKQGVYNVIEEIFHGKGFKNSTKMSIANQIINLKINYDRSSVDCLVNQLFKKLVYKELVDDDVLNKMDWPEDLETIVDFITRMDFNVKLVINKLYPVIYSQNTDNIVRGICIRSSEKLICRVKFENLDEIQQTKFISLAEDYIDVIGDLRGTNNPFWCRMWILLIKFLGVKIHGVLTISNKLLRITELSFRDTQYNEQRLEAFDCWKVLIDNFSLDMEYMSNFKKLKLLLTPMRAKISRLPIVIAKRFDTFVYLIRKIQNRSAMCLEEFLKFCFGPFYDDDDNDKNAKKKNQNWGSSIILEHSTKALMEIIGHNHERICIETSIIKVDKPLIDSSNINRISCVVPSVMECCTLLNNWCNTESNVKCVIECLWRSLFALIEHSHEETKKKCFLQIHQNLKRILNKIDDNPKLYTILLLVLETIVDNKDSLEDLREIVFVCGIELLFKSKPIDCFFTYEKLTSFVFNSINSANYFQIIVRYYDNNSKWCNIELMVNIWLLSVAKNAPSKFSSNLLDFLVWPLFHHEHFTDTKYLEQWKQAYMALCQSDSDKFAVLNKLKEIFNRNPWTMSRNVIWMLHLITTTSSRFVTKEFAYEVINLCSQFIKSVFPEDSVNALNDVLIVFIKCHESVLEKNSELIQLFCRYIDHILTVQKNYECLKKLCNLFTKMDKKLLIKFSELIPIFENLLLNDLAPSNLLHIILHLFELFEFKGQSDQRISPRSSFRKNGVHSPVLQYYNKGKTQSSSPKNEVVLKKSRGRPRKRPTISCIDETSADYVKVDTKVTFQKDKLNQHQKEVLKKTRDDIPALYEDLSRSNSQFDTDSTSSYKDLNSRKETTTLIGVNVGVGEKNISVSFSSPRIDKEIDKSKRLKSNSNLLEFNPREAKRNETGIDPLRTGQSITIPKKTEVLQSPTRKYLRSCKDSGKSGSIHSENISNVLQIQERSTTTNQKDDNRESISKSFENEQQISFKTADIANSMIIALKNSIQIDEYSGISANNINNSTSSAIIDSFHSPKNNEISTDSLNIRGGSNSPKKTKRLSSMDIEENSNTLQTSPGSSKANISNSSSFNSPRTSNSQNSSRNVEEESLNSSKTVLKCNSKITNLKSYNIDISDKNESGNLLDQHKVLISEIPSVDSNSAVSSETETRKRTRKSLGDDFVSLSDTSIEDDKPNQKQVIHQNSVSIATGKTAKNNAKSAAKIKTKRNTGIIRVMNYHKLKQDEELKNQNLKKKDQVSSTELKLNVDQQTINDNDLNETTSLKSEHVIDSSTGLKQTIHKKSCLKNLKINAVGWENVNISTRTRRSNSSYCKPETKLSCSSKIDNENDNRVVPKLRIKMVNNQNSRRYSCDSNHENVIENKTATVSRKRRNSTPGGMSIFPYLTENFNDCVLKIIDIKSPNKSKINDKKHPRTGKFSNISQTPSENGSSVDQNGGECSLNSPSHVKYIETERKLITSPVTVDTPTKNIELLNDTLDISPITFDRNDEVIPSSQHIINNEDRATKLLKLANPSTTSLVNKNVINKKTVTNNKPISPSTRRIQKLMSNFNNKEDPAEHHHRSERKSKENLDILTFTKAIPSPLMAPKRCILKRKLETSLEAPTPKRKRVNFSDPPTSDKKIYIVNSDQDDDNDENVNLKGLRVTLRNKAPICKKLIECEDDISNIVKLLADDDVDDEVLLTQIQKGNIKTVGDLAKLSPTELRNLNINKASEMFIINTVLEKYCDLKTVQDEIKTNMKSVLEKTANIGLSNEQFTEALLMDDQLSKIITDGINKNMLVNILKQKSIEEIVEVYKELNEDRHDLGQNLLNVIPNTVTGQKEKNGAFNIEDLYKFLDQLDDNQTDTCKEIYQRIRRVLPPSEILTWHVDDLLYIDKKYFH